MDIVANTILQLLLSVFGVLQPIFRRSFQVRSGIAPYTSLKEPLAITGARLFFGALTTLVG